MLAGESELAQLLDGDEAALSALLASVREPWPARGLVSLLARTNSPRALDLLARAPDHHARHALDALADALRDGPAPERRRAAAAAALLLARRPPWLPRLAGHDLAVQLLRHARPGRDPRTALHALLALAALLSADPRAAARLWPAVGDALVRLASAPAHPHLAVGTLALFRALYEAHPCALLERLRAECPRNEALRLALPPLLDSVRLHPRLVLGEDRSPSPERRAPSPPAPVRRPTRASPRPPPRSPAPAAGGPAPARPGEPGWFCLSERCGEESAPHTPQPAAEGSPPEAAVEATPENTPVKEARVAFQFPAGRVSPAGAGAGAGVGGRLARVVLERSRAVGGGSPVPLGAVPPAGCVRVRAIRRGPGAAERAARARSCPPRVAAGAGGAVGAGGTLGRREAASQTEEEWSPSVPEPTVADVSLAYAAVGPEPGGVGPCERLDEYLRDLYRGDVGGAAGGHAGGARDRDHLAEQLALTHALLQYERWRRDLHAERNRRLLGRCRVARALEQDNAALRDRVGALRDQLDALRARPPPPAPAAPASQPAPQPDRAERDARLRAEAAVLQAEAERDRARRECGALRARLDEGARTRDAEGRWALVARRRAAAVDALKRELVMRGEREARLAAAAARRVAGAAAAEEARRDAARARAEATAATAALATAEARAAAAESRAADLESAVSAREAALCGARREARAAGEAAAARLAAVQDKYRAVLHALRRVHLRRLEALAGGGAGAGGAGGAVGGAAAGEGGGSPLSASLGDGWGTSPPLSDLSRHLQEEEEAPP